MSTKKDYAGVLFAVLSAVCWSFSGVLGKAVSWNSFSIMGFRAAIATVLLGMARGGFRVRPTRGTLLGALAVTATSLLYLCALRLTTAANAIVLQYAMPAFVILLCWIFYHQRPSLADLITTAFVLLGVDNKKPYAVAAIDEYYYDNLRRCSIPAFRVKPAPLKPRVFSPA